MNYNGGYLIIGKNDKNLLEKLNDALTNGKPILWYENGNTCYYIDTITITVGETIEDIGYVLTKGGKTITVEEDGNITESGNIQPHVWIYNFMLTDSNTDDWYFNIISNKMFNSVKELIEYFSDNDLFKEYELSGFVSGNDTNSHAISNMEYEALNTPFDIYLMYNNESLGGSFIIDGSEKFSNVQKLF